MSNIIFLAKQPERLKNCYTQSQLDSGETLTDEDVLVNSVQRPLAEFIFTTWGMPALTTQQIKHSFPNLKALFFAAGSVQYFARPFLECGVKIFSGWSANAKPVAEFAAAQIILANKGYFQMHRRYAILGEMAQSFCDTYPGNYKTKVGILGAGMIGRSVIKLLQPYDLQLLVFDPFLSISDAVAFGVEKAELSQIFETCQTISCHLANNEHTKEILDYSLFTKMKENGTFINTGRHAQINEAGLIRAMCEAPARTALLDVTDPYEPLPSTSVLWQHENIIISPHRAGAFTGEIMRLGSLMWNEYEALKANSILHCEVTAEMLKTMA